MKFPPQQHCRQMVIIYYQYLSLQIPNCPNQSQGVLVVIQFFEQPNSTILEGLYEKIQDTLHYFLKINLSDKPKTIFSQFPPLF